ncbi:MAG: endonuclease/exonuclease/phosphatase family protein, partial [Gemmatimonadetes bacterium]|nr:endonuclease/exonuclease/phosphatase family protein [Gemmatimonadota bacterium]
CRAEPGAAGRSLAVDWVLRTDRDERAALDAWCWGVGPPVVVAAETDGVAPAIVSLAVRVGNADVGQGEVSELIADLRSGRLAGSPVRDFVLLLQEVRRGGAMVPARAPDWAAAARRRGEARAGRADVVQIAAAAELHLVYAPSMRNGAAGDGRPAEDRGNAILSTLPLGSPALVELPYERQRRVAVLASIAGRTSTGLAWSIRLASVHLDPRARFGRIHRSFDKARAHQARTVADQLANVPAAVVGGDLNTWAAGSRSPAVRLLRQRFPLPEHPPEDGTIHLPWLLPDLRLDHLFFRLPEGWAADYRVMATTYGSDHRPLLGWIRTPAARAHAARSR